MPFTPSALEEVLATHWGYAGFRGQQLAVIEAFLNSRDVIVLFPTGAGKSICYQLPAIVSEFPVLVVSPLIALMEDQVKSLINREIAAATLHSGMEGPEQAQIVRSFQGSEIPLLYVSPEKALSADFLSLLSGMKLGGVAIDEAHCISQWGHTFRPSYLNLAALREILPGTPIMALTGSATRKVKREISEKLRLREPLVFTENLSRKNLHIQVIKSPLPYRALIRILKNAPPDISGIIYMRNRIQCEQVSRSLSHIQKCDFYHARLEFAVRQEKQKKWQSGEVSWMVATNAFGMGIDKSNVRFVIHLGLPPNLEEYVQEIGRAGRDGHDSDCILLYNNFEYNKLRRNFERNYPHPSKLRRFYHWLQNTYQKTNQNEAGQEKIWEDAQKATPSKWPRSLQMAAINHFRRSGLEIPVIPELVPDIRIQIIADESVMGTLNGKMKKVVETLLAFYDQIRYRPVALSVTEVSQHYQIPRSDLLKVFRDLEKFNAIELTPCEDELQKFQNEDKLTWKQFLHQYKRRRRIEKSKIEKMLFYIHARQCRQAYFQHYFGQGRGKPCGICDRCKSHFNSSAEQHSSSFDKGLEHMLAGELTFDDIVSTRPEYMRHNIVEKLSKLELEERISIDRDLIIRTNSQQFT